MGDRKRVFLIVLDSVGIGEMPDSADYGDAGSNTLAACAATGKLSVPNLEKLGLFNIEGVGCGAPAEHPQGAVARLAEAGVPTVAVALRGPYDLAGLPESVWTLAAFEYTEQSIRAVARVLRGEAEPTGRLPVTL